jgi:hypothetical protein
VGTALTLALYSNGTQITGPGGPISVTMAGSGGIEDLGRAIRQLTLQAQGASWSTLTPGKPTGTAQAITLYSNGAQVGAITQTMPGHGGHADLRQTFKAVTDPGEQALRPTLTPGH